MIKVRPETSGGEDLLWLHFRITENNLTIQEVASSEFQIRQRLQFSPKYDLLNPLHPNISMNILLTVLYTIPKVLTRRICLLIKRFFCQ